MPRTGSPLLKHVAAARTRAATLNAVGNMNLAVAARLPRKHEKVAYAHEVMLRNWLMPLVDQCNAVSVENAHELIYKLGSPAVPAVKWHLVCRVDPLGWRFVPIISIREKVFTSPGSRAYQHICYALETEDGDILVRGGTVLVMDPEEADRALTTGKLRELRASVGDITLGIERDAGWFAKTAAEVATASPKPLPLHVDAIGRDRLEAPQLGPRDIISKSSVFR